MQFKMWLNENSRYDDMYSWLSPKGEFFPLFYGSHTDAAVKHSPMENSAAARDDLFKKGWMRITFYNNEIYANNPLVVPNRVQVQELKDLGIMRGHVKKIIYDNDDDEKVIWSSDDAF